MITLSRVKQATAEFIKILRFGENDVQTSPQYLPFGIDSKPIQGLLAAQGKTSNAEDTIVFGYLLQSAETEEGEIRTYSTDADGAVKFYIKQLNNGTCEIGGTADFMTRFTALDTGLQQFIIDLNSKLGTALGTAGSSWPGTSLDISGAKIEEIKTL